MLVSVWIILHIVTEHFIQAVLALWNRPLQCVLSYTLVVIYIHCIKADVDVKL